MSDNSTVAAPTGPPQLPLDVFDTLFAHVYGVALAGIFASCILYGICCMQVFLYYVRKNNDPTFMTYLPGILIVLETAHQLINCIGLYRVVILNFGNQAILVSGVWEIYVATIVQACIALLSQGFFIYRIWSFSKKNWIFPILLIPVALTAFATTVGDQIIALSEPLAEYNVNKVNIGLTYAAHGSDLLVDTLTTISMCFLLHKERKLSMIRRTNALINRLFIVTINTGLATAFCTFIVLVLFATQKTVLSYIFFVFLIPTLYCNSVMANLNSRDYIRGKSTGSKNGLNVSTDLGNSVELGSLKIAPNPMSRRTNETSMGTIDVGYMSKGSTQRTDSTNTIGYDGTDSRDGLKGKASRSFSEY